MIQPLPVAPLQAFPVHDLDPQLFQPLPGSAEELEMYYRLQKNFVQYYENVFPDIIADKTVIIVPSLSVDQEIMQQLDGAVYYEERMLAMLMLLRMPRTHLIYITSVPIDPVIVDYYLHLLPGITGYHARQRLTFLSCFDASPKSLTQKILERPRMIERIRKSIPASSSAHIACFNMTILERTLAVQLNLPIYACDPDLLHLGTKSGSRKIFKECGLDVPEGEEDLRDEQDVVEVLTQLKKNNPALRKAVVKMNDGFSGEGNAVFSYEGSEQSIDLNKWIADTMPKKLEVAAEGMSYETFMSKFKVMNGVVEAFIEGEVKRSPSVQCRVTPMGTTDVISTHDQVLGGLNNQTFIGANFPASTEYAKAIGVNGKCIAEKLKDYGVLGRFSADFISTKTDEGWKHYALELNLRKGGTTHPYIMLIGLTDGRYDVEKGIYLTASEQPRYYFSSDNVKDERYRGLTPHDLMDIAIYNRLQYDGSSQQGVMFHLCGALSQYGKLGVVCIGATAMRASAMYRRTIQVLNREGARQ